MARVVFIGEVRQYTGDDDAIETDAANVMQLFKILGQRYPRLAPVLESGFAVAIDGQLMEDSLLQPIIDAKEIVLVPKIEGG
ncbi:MAG: MoaD/ThiS family protein [Rhodospirillales bacterium]|nr:molybdopterin synthase sulfur carrier subunit [Rhodospirillaceae bacterium]MDP6430308.1 MoaD/ThiS family protein [Rhodospirillales bacterium]MDP6646388.1 MoaD/ThiS family protein [Rhodospirillales bacterium]MDP6841555.1 MoaD/ThiS family protein [Rhodospirillales bacterium]